MTEEPQKPTGWSRLAVPVLLTGLSAIPPLSIDMFLPSMPAMAEEFQTDPSHIQPAVTVFLVALGAAQLFFGAFSDRFGRRPVLLAGLVCYTLAGLGCMLAPTVSLLILARGLQGFSGGSGPSVSRAIIRDIYGKEDSARIMAYIATASALAPIIAPIIGGFFQAYFNWQSVFVVLSNLGGLLFIGYLFIIPESNKMIDPTALNAKHMLANYRDLLTNRQYVGNVLMVAILFWGMFAFITNSSFVLITELGLPPQIYGFCFGGVAMGLMLGAFFSGKLDKRLGGPRIIYIGCAVSACAGFLLAGLKLTGIFSVFSIVLPMCLFTIGSGMVRPQAMAAAIVPYPEKAGLASAFMGFVPMSTAGLFVTLFAYFFSASSTAMVIAIACSGVTVFLMRRILLPIQKTEA